MQKKTVTILMATYNGQKHIRNQILSLQQQKFSDWILYIQDDGSKDKTMSIVSEMSQCDARINIVTGNIHGQGAGRNFLSLVKYSSSDYTIFCDQDDIWLENKLSDMVDYANNLGLDELDTPSLVYADGYAFSDDSGVIDFSGISHNHAAGLRDFLFFNGGYQGCSIMFNHAMARLLENYTGNIHLHDDIASLAAHCLGSVHFLPKKLMLYRQHSNAVTGVKSFQNNFKAKLFSSVDYLLSHKHYLVKKSFFENYKSEMSCENKNTFARFIVFCETKSKISEVISLLQGGFRLNNSKIKLLCKFALRKKFDE